MNIKRYLPLALASFGLASPADARPKPAKYTIEVQFVRTADDDGGNPTTLTKAQAQAAIDAANDVYSNKGGDVRFVLHPDSNFGSVIKSTTLNRDCPLQPGYTASSIAKIRNPDLDGDGEKATKADAQKLCDYQSTFLARTAYAVERADRIVVFPRGHRKRVRYNWDKHHWEVYQFAGGSADPDGMYVNMPAGAPPKYLLAHELGHYLHVWHTFGPNPKTIAQAATMMTDWAAEHPGEDPRDVFNGDAQDDKGQTYRVYDTPPDPRGSVFNAVHGTKCGSTRHKGIVKVPAKIGGQTKTYVLAPDRNNVMSYFACPDKPAWFSPQQWDHIHDALDNGNRKSLVTPKHGPKPTCYATNADALKLSTTPAELLNLIRKISACLKLEKRPMPWEEVVNGDIYVNPSDISAGFTNVGGVGVHLPREAKMLEVLMGAELQP